MNEITINGEIYVKKIFADSTNLEKLCFIKYLLAEKNNAVLTGRDIVILESMEDDYSPNIKKISTLLTGITKNRIKGLC